MTNPFTTCGTCGGEREMIEFEDLPEEMQKDWSGLANLAFYCPKCESYTVGGIGGLDDDLDLPPQKMKFVSKPAANNPCPCGSKKKYKRCCGLK